MSNDKDMATLKVVCSNPLKSKICFFNRVDHLSSLGQCLVEKGRFLPALKLHSRVYYRIS